ncbi:hypothetical protein ACNTMW_31065 [Planosporangium sp. 12N6]|uniref:hypothetical protein n=1 Tax=Planosporangium spinosum TaxID=3402278 RepID=UPI003CF07182
MSILAVQDPLGTAWVRDHDVSARTSTQNPAERARLVAEAIEHHRAESRRLATEAKQHRTRVTLLLELRRQHVAELHAAGWGLAPIGRLYRLTRERVRQLVATARTDIDDSIGVV